MWIISWQVVSLSQSDGVSSSSVSQCFRSSKTQPMCDGMVAVPASQLSCFPWLQHVPDSASTGVIKGGCIMLNIATCLSRLPIPLFTFAASLANRLGHWYVMYGLTVISWLSLLEVHEMMFNLITAIAVKFLGWKKMFSMITVPNIGVCLWSYISNLYTVVTTLCPKWHFDQLLC